MSRLLPAALVVLALLGLTACDGDSTPTEPSTADAQSVAAACAAVDESVADAVAALAAVDPADPAAAAEAVAGVGEHLQAASEAVTNAAMADLLPRMQDDLAAIGAGLEAIAGGDLSQSAALAAPMSRMQQSFADFRELCGRS